jgi:hypothetical protein
MARFWASGLKLAGSFVAAAIGTAAGALWLQHGLGAPFFFVMGTLAALAVAGDIRLVARRGVIGIARLRRHLWCTAMLITVLSFFIGQAQVLPLWFVRTRVNSLPVFATLIYLIFWLIRTRIRKAAVVAAVAVG